MPLQRSNRPSSSPSPAITLLQGMRGTQGVCMGRGTGNDSSGANLRSHVHAARCTRNQMHTSAWLSRAPHQTAMPWTAALVQHTHSSAQQPTHSSPQQRPPNTNRAPLACSQSRRARCGRWRPSARSRASDLRAPPAAGSAGSPWPACMGRKQRKGCAASANCGVRRDQLRSTC